MLKKIQEIHQLGVFKDFNWNSEVKNNGGAVQSLVDINIIYGRNYSGKTTLSRIVRALETERISDKYGNPSFRLIFSDQSVVTESDLTSHGKNVRVFNEDFIRENLRFIADPDENIEPFAILGDENNKIEKEIEKLEEELGSSEEGQESGMFALKNAAFTNYNTAFQAHKKAYDNLEKQLGDKATDKEVGIKYKPERFGDQNYTITKLKAELNEVQEPDYQPLETTEIDQYEKLIEEKILPDISKLNLPTLNFSSFVEEADALVTKKISESDKIEGLVKDAILNRWVNEGREHHRNKHEKCAFCDNDISQRRWLKLDKHFDEESEQLEKDIGDLIQRIEDENSSVSTALTINKSNFYSKFHIKLAALETQLKLAVQSYQDTLSTLVKQLKSRKNDILNTKAFNKPIDSSNGLNLAWQKYQSLCSESNLFSGSLSGEQSCARDVLRLKEVSDYQATIDYQRQLESIDGLSQNLKTALNEKTCISREINQKRELINAKKRELNDEEKGAKKVNEYLNNFFGHKFLTLEAKQDDTGEESSKRIRFEVVREGKKAYHLSEGECSLLAFCYFLAKLKDIETLDSKPIIWIDDPISSLDGNHIFFIYSLLNAEVVAKGEFEQLIISTHNLDFLKYLKRLKNCYFDSTGKKVSFQKAYFIVVRQDKTALLQVMPSYLKEYVTEFNYLFHQIYKCATIEVVDDTNYITFYNFANNARKFLEIYLYYKFPDQGMNEETLSQFFGEESVPAVLTDRINNEYSHLCGVFERGATPVEVPEMLSTARLIIDKLKEDSDQYSALLTSVGENVELEEA